MREVDSARARPVNMGHISRADRPSSTPLHTGWWGGGGGGRGGGAVVGWGFDPR